MKKLIYHGWCEDEYIFSKFSFLGELFNNLVVIAFKQHISSKLAWSYKQRLIDSSKCLGPLARRHLAHRRGWTAVTVTQNNIFPVFSAWAGKTLAGKTQTLALAPNPPSVSPSLFLSSSVSFSRPAAEPEMELDRFVVALLYFKLLLMTFVKQVKMFIIKQIILVLFRRAV